MRMYLAAALHNVIKTASKILGLPKLPCLFNGKWVWFPVESWPEIVLDYEPHIARVIERELRSGGCFVDVGAHLGYWYLFAPRFPGIQIVAVEPSPRFDLLLKAVAKLPGVLPIRAGCGSAAGEVSFYAHGINTIGTLSPEVAAAYDSFGDEPIMEEIKVKVLTLDDIVSSRGITPSLVKIDVEGYEVEVLRGAQKLLASEGVAWIIEVHPWQTGKAGDSEEELYSILDGFGYIVEHLGEHSSDVYSVIARRGPVG